MQGEGLSLRHPAGAGGGAVIRGTALAAFICLLAGLAAAPAMAAPSWLTPVDLSADGQDAEAPQVAVDAAGDAVAVWSRPVGTHTIVQSATRPAGGAWSAPLDLSAAGRDATDPQLALDPAGNAVAVWARFDGSHTIVQSAAKPAGGAWSAPLDLSADGQNAEAPQVAIDPAGNAVAVWARYDSTRYIIQSARRPAGGAWESPPLDLSATGQNAESPQVAIDSAGNAVAVWSRSNGSRLIVQSATRPAGGAWESPPLDLSATGQNAEEPQVVVDPAGDATAVWSRSDGSKYIVQAASRPAGGAWDSPHDLSASGQNAEAPQVAADSSGNAVAVWARFTTGPNAVIQAATKPVGGLWSSPLDLSLGGVSTAETPQVAIGPGGEAVAVWARSEASPTVVQSAAKPFGAPWNPPLNLSVIGRNATEPQVALDPAGDGVATWSRDNGASAIVQAIGRDGAGPQLRALSIATAGTIGQPLSFSVSPFDAWSAIGSIGWTFGDEGAASGRAVTHEYASPGVYPVAVSASDSLGHGTGATGTVTIYPKASAARNVRVRGGKALLRLTCPSPAGCEGTLKLIAGVKVMRNHRRVGKRVPIGQATFSIPGATTTTVPVRLTKKGRQLVKEANRSGVKSQLTGPGVRHRIVALLPPRR